MDQRIKWIDIAKGMGIILVIVGHTFRDEMLDASFVCYFLRNFIYSFHMQLFFFLSGFLLERTLEKHADSKKVIRKKIDSVLKPFVVYSLLVYIVFRCVNCIPAIERILDQSSYQAVGIVEYIINCIMGNNPYAVHLWYLFVLFIFEMISIFVRKAAGEKANGIVFLAAILMYMAGANVNPAIMTINAILKRFLFFVLGQFLYRHSSLLYSKSHMMLVAEIISLALIIGDVSFSFEFQNIIVLQLYYFIMLAAKCFVVLLIIRAAVKLQENKILSYLGRNSFSIYILHQPWCAMVGVILYTMLGRSALIVCILCAIVSLVIPLLYLNIIRKNSKLQRLSKLLLNIS